MSRADLLSKLAGGDRRSIGRSHEVVAEVLADPSLFDAVFQGMLAPDPLLRMRAADAVEKITITRPEHLRPYKQALTEKIANVDQKEVRWHFARMCPRLPLTAKERRQVAETLTGYLHDHSKIVKTFAMQALADLAARDAGLLQMALTHLKELTLTGSPAMRNRGRKLLSKLEPKAASADQINRSVKKRRVNSNPT